MELESEAFEKRVDEIDSVLPQWQCRRCEYDGCYAYAQAIVAGAPINRCPPGGKALLQQLAKLTHNITHNTEALVEGIDPQLKPVKPLSVARIESDACIGCTRCIRACPLDAIAGGRRAIHYVLSDDCSGCELCLPVCPMDCIVLEPSHTPDWQMDDSRKIAWRRAAVRRRQRLQESDYNKKEAKVSCLNSNADLPKPSAESVEYTSWIHQQVTHATQKAAQLLKETKSREEF